MSEDTLVRGLASATSRKYDLGLTVWALKSF